MYSTTWNCLKIVAQDNENVSVIWAAKLRGFVGWTLFCSGYTQSIFTLHLSICLFLKSRHPAVRTYNYNKLFFLAHSWKQEKTNRMWWSHFSPQSVCHCIQHLLSTFFPILYCFISFNARKGNFIFQMMSAEGQTSGRFLVLLLCLLETPGVFARQSGQSLALDLGHWTGSFALIAQVIDQIKESTVITLSVLRDGCHWLTESGRQGYVSVQSVYQYSFYLSCHLVDLAVLFSLVQRPVLNCIKLYRLCKKLNVAKQKRKAIPYRWQSDLKCIKEIQKQSLGDKCNILFVITIFCWKRATG